MGTTNFPLYVSDLDGTLLRNDTSLSQYSKDTLNALLDQGLLFTVASARSIASMRHVLADLPLRLPVVEFNGAFVMADEALAVANAIPALKEQATGIIETNEEDGVARYISSHWDGILK